MTGRIMISFEGDGAGEGELTWGQQGIWRTISNIGRSEYMGGVMPLPEGTTVHDAVLTTRFVMRRHPSLRTRLRFTADGRPRQVVSARGEVPLELVEAGAADPAEVARAVRERYESTDFDYVNEWPVRMALVLRDGVATHAVSVYLHLAMDAFGLEALMADLATMDRETGEAPRPPTGITALELAAQQAQPATLRQGAASIRYWERLLRSVPTRRFGESADRREPRYWVIRYHSPAALLAMRALAARVNSDTSPVLLATFAVALARVTGNNPVVTQLVVSNRFRRGFAGTVSPVAQAGICAVDVAGVTMSEAVTRAGRAAMSAYKYAYYKPGERLALYEAVARDRGEQVDVSCYFNDRRERGRQRPTGLPPTGPQIRAALPLSCHEWDRPTDVLQPELYLSIDESADALHFKLTADTHCLSPADIEAVAREMETVIVTAALDPEAVTAVCPAPVAAR